MKRSEREAWTRLALEREQREHGKKTKRPKQPEPSSAELEAALDDLTEALKQSDR